MQTFVLFLSYKCTRSTHMPDESHAGGKQAVVGANFLAAGLIFLSGRDVEALSPPGTIEASRSS